MDMAHEDSLWVSGREIFKNRLRNQLFQSNIFILKKLKKHVPKNEWVLLETNN